MPCPPVDTGDPCRPAGRARGRVAAALITVQILFGLHYLAAKRLLEEIEPRVWALARVAAAAVLLAAAVRLGRRRWPRRQDRLAVAGLSLFGVVINQVCFVEGLSRTSPTHSALINTTIPVLTLLIAILLRQERVDRRRVLAVALAFAGALAIIDPRSAAAEPVRVAGDLLTALNAASFALFLVLSKPVVARNDPLGVTALLFLFGAGGVLAVAAPELPGFRPGEVSAEAWGLAVFIVVGPTVGAYLLNYWALARAASSEVALFIYLQPLVAAGLATACFGERPGMRVIGGGLLVCAGVYAAVRVPTPAGGDRYPRWRGG
ncbi:MAG: DMT family transporter [Acidobacteria bacterium]|nr:MAG: DMT family transporter [Acidobacteriota bacterium]